MVPLLSSHHNSAAPLLFLSSACCRHSYSPPLPLPFPLRRPLAPLLCLSSNLSPFDPYKQKKQQQQQLSQPRTLYPGGYKRPEIKVPSLVLQLEPNDVLDTGSNSDILDLIDKAVSRWVRIVVLNGGQATAAKLYKAACLLKSVVQDRAYLLVAERADIAAAAGASGVLLSDQGLPAIVARNTMLDSRSGSVILPLVARNVQSADAAFIASKAEGADFLIYSMRNEKRGNFELDSLFKNVKIPIFITLRTEDVSFLKALSSFKFGPSGFVFPLKSFQMLSDDVLRTLVQNIPAENGKSGEQKSLVVDNGSHSKTDVLAGFLNLDEREKQFIEAEKSVLIQAMKVIKKAAPLMEEVSLLDDAISQIDEPFLLVIVGEFNSGKSSVINALLGKRYLEEGVVPTTNEITFLRHTEFGSEEQHCERHPDGQFVCYLPAPILRQMIIVDTPGTNVILQRQQRLTEEFVPRADLLLFVISADRPLTESEVSFLRYTQQWKKKVVFVLNKADLYQNTRELEEAMLFIKENVQKLLNTDNVILYPVSARSALEAKLSCSSEFQNHHVDSAWRASSFCNLEKFLYSFLDGSSSTGMERMKLKLRTPVAIADRLISAGDILVKHEARKAKQDLTSVNDIVNGVKDFGTKMENESLSWRRQVLSLIDDAESRVLELVEATLRLSNLDAVASFVFRGEMYVSLPMTSRLQNDIIGLAVSSARNLLVEYGSWLQSNNTQQGMLYKESFEKQWPLLMHQNNEVHLERYELLKRVNHASYGVIENVNGITIAKSFEREIREVYLGTFGGLGAAGLSASLLTSVLPTTLEDLLALGLCSAGGYLAISYFPIRRQRVIDKVKRTADALANEVEEAMKKDVILTIEDLENFVKVLSQPYQDQAQSRLERLLQIQDELSKVDQKLRTLQIDIQNLHMV